MQNMKTVSFGAAFSLTRPEPADYTDADGNTQTAAQNVPRFNYSDGIAEGLLLDSLLTETAAIIDVPMFNPMEGTWVFSAEMENCRPLPGSGFDELLTGSGTLVFTYSWRDGRRLGQCWANGELLYTVDPITAGQATHLTTGGNAKMHRVAYLPAAWSDAQASEESTGAFEIVAPWDFEADYENQRYGSRDETGAFIYRAFSDEHTFTRPSPKHLLVDGQFVTYPAGEPAFGDDGINLEYSSVNVVSYGIPDANVPTGWTQGNASPAGFGQLENGLAAVIFNATSDRQSLSKVISLEENTEYTLSAYIDVIDIGDDRPILQVVGFSDSVGDIWAVASDADSNGRVQFTFTTGVDVEGQIRWGIGTNQMSSGHIKMSGIQLEKGPVATSPIITEADPLTRAQDLLSLDDLQSGAWFGDTMTWIMDLTPAYPTIQSFLLTDGTSDRIFSLIGSNNRYGMYDGDSTTSYHDSFIPVAGERRVLAAAYNPLTGEMKICAGGAVVKAPYNGSFGSLNSLSVFTNGAIGTLHSLRAKRGYATDAEMQELTQ